MVLTVRDPDDWYDSMIEAFEPLVATGRAHQHPEVATAFSTWYRIIIDELFDGRFRDRRHSIRVFQDHAANVSNGVTPERLLVFSPDDGWEPLCRFLDRPVPDVPFPRMNSRRSVVAPIVREVKLEARSAESVTILG